LVLTVLTSLSLNNTVVATAATTVTTNLFDWDPFTCCVAQLTGITNIAGAVIDLVYGLTGFVGSDGETKAREVVATLPHRDQLVTLDTSAGEIVTTEGHRYWNVTDGEWQPA
jgi:hypothetical protein